MAFDSRCGGARRWIREWVLFVAAVPAIGCGGSSADTGAAATGHFDDTGTTGEPDAAEGADATTGPGPGDASTSSDASTGDDTTGTTTVELTTGTEDSGSTGDGGVVYGATVFPAPEVPILIYKADFDAGTCTRIRLESPAAPAPPLDTVDTPDYYNIYAAEISQEPDDCNSLPLPDTYVEAVAGVGTIRWSEDGPGVCPTEIEIDVTLEYPAGRAWVPASEQLVAVIDSIPCL